MHDFYLRVEAEFTKQRKSRNLFCKERDIPYSSLQRYWESDRLPQGDVLAELADYLGVSLDYLIFGKTCDLDNTTESIVDLIKNADRDQKIELRGIIKQYLTINAQNPQKKRHA